MSTIGHAVGDWNSGKKVYPNPEFVNFGRGFGNQNQPATIKPFFIDRISMRDAWKDLGINWSEYNKRRFIVKRFKSKGISLPQLNEYWNKYLLRGNDAKNQKAFETFISQQRLLEKAQIKREEELIAQLEEEEKQKEISDLNLFPPTTDESLSDTTTISEDVVEDSKPNYLLYGGIGLAVLIGGFLIFKRK